MSSSCRDIRHNKQGGAALIIALVVVLLVVMLATRVSSDYLVLFRTVENQGELQQARAWLRGAELVAKEALLRDLATGSEFDSALEVWGQTVQLPLPEGVLTACMADLQGRLNLNDLLAPAGEFSAAQKRFIRLLQVVDDSADNASAVALANAVFDWVDPDSDPRYPGGAEALDYLQVPQQLSEPQAQPYRPANQGFASSSELLLVKGFSRDMVAALTPYVAVWGNGNLNLNTMDAHLANADPATAKPVMLRTLNNSTSLLPLSVDGALLLASARGNGGVLQNMELFSTGPFAAQDWELDGVALTSAYFELTADLRTEARQYHMTSVLQRAVSLSGVPEVTVVSRRFGGLAETGGTPCVTALP